MNNIERLVDRFCYWVKQPVEKIAAAAKKSKKSTKKLDPKAEIRNKKNPVFPANSPKVKDNADHFPLADIGQARAALSYAGHYTKAPSWYKGTLEELKAAVRRAVKKHFPSIDVSEPKQKKKSSLELLIEKYS